MAMLMQKLQLPIPDFEREFRLKVELSEDNKKIKMYGVDDYGKSSSLFKQVQVSGLSP